MFAAKVSWHRAKCHYSHVVWWRRSWAAHWWTARVMNTLYLITLCCRATPLCGLCYIIHVCFPRGL